MSDLNLYHNLRDLQLIQHEVDKDMEVWEREKIITA